MIKFCLKQWDKNKQRLEDAIREDRTLNECEYKHLVEMVVEYILNDENSIHYNKGEITVIDNGDYQGTLLFLIPENTYQPSASDYLMTFVEYGSCSGCDTLQAIQDWGKTTPTEQQVKDFMMLCKDLVCNMIKPYNTGWRNNEDFEQVEFED